MGTPLQTVPHEVANQLLDSALTAGLRPELYSAPSSGQPVPPSTAVASPAIGVTLGVSLVLAAALFVLLSRERAPRVPRPQVGAPRPAAPSPEIAPRRRVRHAPPAVSIPPVVPANPPRLPEPTATSEPPPPTGPPTRARTVPFEAWVRD